MSSKVQVVGLHRLIELFIVGIKVKWEYHSFIYSLLPKNIGHPSSSTPITFVSIVIIVATEKAHLYASIFQLVNIQDTIYQTSNTTLISNDLDMTLKNTKQSSMQGNEGKGGNTTIIVLRFLWCEFWENSSRLTTVRDMFWSHFESNTQIHLQDNKSKVRVVDLHNKY